MIVQNLVSRGNVDYLYIFFQICTIGGQPIRKFEFQRWLPPGLAASTYFLEEKGALIPITERTLSTIKACAKQWKHLDGLQRSTAEKFISDLEDSVSFGTLGYHALCYRRFTDKTRIKRAAKRCAQQRKTKPEALCTETPPHRSSRSTNSGVEKGEQRKNSYVLPEQCIICKGIKYIKNPHTKS